ncbi:MAG: endonuclease/exonuclease/phosphatase family protein, partial [Clostridium sp.]|nr:endonuclease/exonuclease/phosphatase family protein [Clostridium sp.]
FQLNLWHGGTCIDDGYNAIVNILDEMDADVIFLCEIREPASFIPKLAASLEERGKRYHGGSNGVSTGLLSRFPVDSIGKCCIVPEDESRAMVKATANVYGHKVTFYSCHLDYTHYECYMPRGYSGTTWKKTGSQVTDQDVILEANRLSYRDESIAAFIEDAAEEIAKGHSVVMGGDFNEPSHLDWQEDTRWLWDHNGAIVNWDCSIMLLNAGFRDSYREKYPDPVKNPGFTFPAGNHNVEKGKLAWAPDADERDRIDFIYYSAGKKSNLRLKDITITGPSGTVLKGEITENGSKDRFHTPAAKWPSDHKGNLAIFRIR